MTAPCPFCDLLRSGTLLAESPVAAAFLDAFPVSPGHTLVVPRRHVSGFWDLTGDEATSIMDLAFRVKPELDERFSPDGYNLGVNVGPAGGQTVDHAHLHVIPRYRGDSADPRGGVRWLLPARAVYWGPQDNS